MAGAHFTGRARKPEPAKQRITNPNARPIILELLIEFYAENEPGFIDTLRGKTPSLQLSDREAIPALLDCLERSTMPGFEFDNNTEEEYIQATLLDGWRACKAAKKSGSRLGKINLACGTTLYFYKKESMDAQAAIARAFIEENNVAMAESILAGKIANIITFAEQQEPA